MASCTEKFGDAVEGTIAGSFHTLGSYVGSMPRKTIAASIILAVLMGYGFSSWETENRNEKLWIPQDTTAAIETEMYEGYFPSSSRFNQLILQSSSSENNVLSKDSLEEAMALHKKIETGVVVIDDMNKTFADICTQAGGSCATPSLDGICSCLVESILGQWNYDLETLQNDDDYMATLNGFGSKTADLAAILGNPTFDETGRIVSAEAFTISYFLEADVVVIDGTEVDEVGEKWEETVFLAVAESATETFSLLSVDYFAFRSFGDEFGGAITGDLLLVQVSYIAAFLFLGANLGNIKCGAGSRWTMALGALVTVG